MISALTQREQLTEIVELPQDVHPWFIGVQFHPEFKSTPWDGHPLFNCFIKAALEHQRRRSAAEAVMQPKPPPEGRRMKLADFDDRPGPAVLPHRRPLRRRIRAVADGHRRRS